ncbi:hypothetical protein RchiOBHm_Chr1g0370301 [Rosa chinensis]|uniref:Uncharacterized protein n=1 Tax=Rosa chinensis TaxID=74649 RepID=A0A2P6SLA1_ROSCH|nr:hypothetical protein RchiOBHm_Chr1g0370301 [Rosa chinensis]
MRGPTRGGSAWGWVGFLGNEIDTEEGWPRAGRERGGGAVKVRKEAPIRRDKLYVFKTDVCCCGALMDEMKSDHKWKMTDFFFGQFSFLFFFLCL